MVLTKIILIIDFNVSFPLFRLDLLSFISILSNFNLIIKIIMSTHLEIVVAKAKPVMPIFIFIKSIFNIIFNIFAKAVAIIGVLVSLVDLRQLDKIKDKHKNIIGTDTIT